MAVNPEAKTTIVNVKGIDHDAWEAARNAANRQSQTMGEWVSRALIHLVNLEAGPRDFPPNPAANLDAKTVKLGQTDAMAALATLAPVLAGIGPKLTKTAAADVSGLLSELAREARGLPPRTKVVGTRRGKASGQALLENGKAPPGIGIAGPENGLADDGEAEIEG